MDLLINLVTLILLKLKKMLELLDASERYAPNQVLSGIINSFSLILICLSFVNYFLQLIFVFVALEGNGGE